MPTKTWKSVEREAASFFGTRRNPLSGENSGHKTNSDTLDPEIYCEVKYRKKHAACFLWRSEFPKAQKEGKLLIIALKEKHQGRREGEPGFLVVLDPRDLIRVAEILKRRKGQSCKAKLEW